MMEKQIKISLLLGLAMIIIGFLMWAEISFTFIGIGVIIVGISLILHINKNN